MTNGQNNNPNKDIDKKIEKPQSRKIYNVGDIIGEFTILEKWRDAGRTMVKLQCSCGSEPIIKRLDYFGDKRALQHCGCKSEKKKDELVIGKKFNRLIVIELPYRIDGDDTLWVKCTCECSPDIVREFRAYSILNGDTNSCGCYNKDKLHERTGENHPMYKHGKTNTKLFKVWAAIRYKCVDEWKNFTVFEEWSLDKYKPKLCLTRKDVFQLHSPTNSEFITYNEISKRAYKEEHTKLAKETNKIRYGVDSYSKTKEFEERRKAKNLEKIGYEYPAQNPDIQSQIINTKKERGQIYYFNGKSFNEFAEEKGICSATLSRWIKDYGLEKALKMDRSRTCIEATMKELLDEIGLPYKEQVAIGTKIVDFVVNNIAIECDGLYWHSDKSLEDKFYHANKRKELIKEGYFPLFFREDEINNKIPIIKSIICNKLKLNTSRIYGRECKIVDTKSKEFFEINHLMGRGNGSYIFLEHDDKLVAGMRYYRRDGITVISRYCTLLNTTVVGGFSKLIKRLELPISTFIDLRYGSGGYVTKLGFQHVRTGLSFRWVYKDTSFHRMKFPNNTGYENGLAKIWDCGQALYLLS